MTAFSTDFIIVFVAHLIALLGRGELSFSRHTTDFMEVVQRQILTNWFHTPTSNQRCLISQKYLAA